MPCPPRKPIARISLPGPIPRGTSITAAIVDFPGDPNVNGGLHPQWQAEFDKSRASRHQGGNRQERYPIGCDKYLITDDVEAVRPKGSSGKLSYHIWGKAHYIEREDLIARTPGLEYNEMFRQATANATENLIGLGYLDEYGDPTKKDDVTETLKILKRTFPPATGIFKDPVAPKGRNAAYWRATTVKNVKEGIQHCKRNGGMARYIRACLRNGGIEELCEEWEDDVRKNGEAGSARDEKLFGNI